VIHLSDVTDIGRAWAERQHTATPRVTSSWTATWQDAIRLGLVEPDKRHELASLCAVAARQRWRELRPDAPPAHQGATKTNAQRRATTGRVVASVTMPAALLEQTRALASRAHTSVSGVVVEALEGLLGGRRKSVRP
jgi:hypothetical protein